MKADIFIQGHLCATISIPSDSLLGLLARGMITEAAPKLQRLARDLSDLDQVQCSVSLRIRTPTPYSRRFLEQNRQEQTSWPDKGKPNGSSTRPTKP